MSRRFVVPCPRCGCDTEPAGAGEQRNIMRRICRDPDCRSRSEWICEFSHLLRPPLSAPGLPVLEVVSGAVRGRCACGEKAGISKTDPQSPELYRLYMVCKGATCGCRFVATLSHHLPISRPCGITAQELIRHLLALYPRHELDKAFSGLDDAG